MAVLEPQDRQEPPIPSCRPFLFSLCLTSSWFSFTACPSLGSFTVSLHGGLWFSVWVHLEIPGQGFKIQWPRTHPEQFGKQVCLCHCVYSVHMPHVWIPVLLGVEQLGCVAVASSLGEGMLRLEPFLCDALVLLRCCLVFWFGRIGYWLLQSELGSCWSLDELASFPGAPSQRSYTSSSSSESRCALYPVLFAAPAHLALL